MYDNVFPSVHHVLLELCTVKEQQEGFGGGLVIVRLLSQEHGGPGLAGGVSLADEVRPSETLFHALQEQCDIWIL